MPGRNQRAALIAEAKEFIDKEEFMRLATSFPGWVPIDPVTGKAPPDWKTAILVLLGLYPIVSLEVAYLLPDLSRLTQPLVAFVGNVLSIALTTYLTMPIFLRIFGWWLFLDENKPKWAIEIGGALLMCALFAAEITIFWLIYHSQQTVISP